LSEVILVADKLGITAELKEPDVILPAGSGGTKLAVRGFVIKVNSPLALLYDKEARALGPDVTSEIRFLV
jgi:hypothetical protein